MQPWIVLPYDASPLARAALRRAAAWVASGRAAGVIVVTAGVDPAALDRLADEAQALAGRETPLELYLLNAGDPVGSFVELARSLGDALIMAPVGPGATAPWYAEVRRADGGDHPALVEFISARECAREEAVERERPGVADRVGLLLRGGARLRAGLRPALAEARR